MSESNKVSELERLIRKVVKQEIDSQNKSILALPKLPLVILISSIMCLMIAVTTIGVKMATSTAHREDVRMLEDDMYSIMIDNLRADQRIEELQAEVASLKLLHDILMVK